MDFFFPLWDWWEIRKQWRQQQEDEEQKRSLSNLHKGAALCYEDFSSIRPARSHAQQTISDLVEELQHDAFQHLSCTASQNQRNSRNCVTTAFFPAQTEEGETRRICIYWRRRSEHDRSRCELESDQITIASTQRLQAVQGIARQIPGQVILSRTGRETSRQRLRQLLQLLPGGVHGMLGAQQTVRR